MPCYATGSAEGDAKLSRDESQKEATKLARLLCQACRVIDKVGYSVQMPHELFSWWDEHQRIDELRIRREAEEERKTKYYYRVSLPGEDDIILLLNSYQKSDFQKVVGTDVKLQTVYESERVEGIDVINPLDAAAIILTKKKSKNVRTINSMELTPLDEMPTVKINPNVRR